MAPPAFLSCPCAGTGRTCSCELAYQKLCKQPFLCPWKCAHHLLPFRTSNPLTTSLYSHSLHVMICEHPQETHPRPIWLSLHPVQSPCWYCVRATQNFKHACRSMGPPPLSSSPIPFSFPLNPYSLLPWQYKLRTTHTFSLKIHTQKTGCGICVYSEISLLTVVSHYDCPRVFATCTSLC